MSGNQGDGRLVLRFVIALGLAIVAGVMNYIYVSGGGKKVDVLAYSGDVEQGASLEDKDFMVVSLPAREGTLQSSLKAAFRTPEERAILIGSSSATKHVRGELVLKKGVKTAASPAPELAPFGNFEVLSVSGNVVTVKAGFKEGGSSFDDDTNRLFQITSGTSQSSTYRVYNIVELASPKGKENESGSGVLNSDLSDGVEENEVVSGSDDTNVNKVTVQLPKGCYISNSIKPKTKVAFVVPITILTDRERKTKRQTGN